MSTGAVCAQAATKIAAMHRGKAARRERAEQAEAATKMQAIQRGRMARKQHLVEREGTAGARLLVDGLVVEESDVRHVENVVHDPLEDLASVSKVIILFGIS